MITYYSDIKDLKSIHNPMIDNAVAMRHSGFFEKVENDQTPYFATSLKKTLHNQGRVFCSDSSKLFSISSGYISLLMSVPYNIQDGALFKTKFSDKDYMIWGVNMGQEDISASGIGAFFTKNGIEFKVKTSGGNYSLIDNISNIYSDQTFEIEFMWDNTGIKTIDESPTMLIRVNDEDVIGGVIPIVDDLNVNNSFYTAIGQSAPSGTSVFSNVEFQAFENIYKLNNLPCMFSRIIIGDSIPIHYTEAT